MLLATFLNRVAFKDRVGNLRIVAFKLFQFAVILAIASQIQWGTSLDPMAHLFIQLLGYVFLSVLVFDLFFIYPNNAKPRNIMMVSNIVLWITGAAFFATMMSHYYELQDPARNQLWKEAGMYPMANIKHVWNKRVLPKMDTVDIPTVMPTKSTFNLFSTMLPKNGAQ